MTPSLQRLAHRPFRSVVWLAPFALTVHEAEEWNILEWYHQYWSNVGPLSDRTVRTWLIFYSILGIVITWIATRFESPRVTAFVVVFFFAFPFLHGFLHVYWTFYFGAYSPGVLSSIFLLIPVCAFIGIRSIRERLVPFWFVGSALFLNLPQVVGAIRMGDSLPDGGLPFYRLSAAIARLLLGAP